MNTLGLRNLGLKKWNKGARGQGRVDFVDPDGHSLWFWQFLVESERPWLLEAYRHMPGTQGHYPWHPRPHRAEIWGVQCSSASDVSLPKAGVANAITVSNRSLGIAPRLDKQLPRQGIYNSRQWTLKNLPCSRDQRQWPTATVAQSHNDPKPWCPIALLSDFCSLWLGGSWRLLWLCLTDIPAIGKKVILSSHPLARLKYLKCKVLKFQYQTNNTFHFPHNSWLTRTSAEKKMCAGAILTTTKPGRNSNNRKGQGGPERMGKKKKKRQWKA